MEKNIQNTEDKAPKSQKEIDAEILLKARRETLEAQKEKESFSWLTDHSRNFLEAGYLVPGVSPEQRIREIAERAEDILGIEGYANKFYHYMSQGFFSLASPVWSNFGKERGLPISCFGSSVSDDMGNILYTQSEVGMMSKLGGGTSGYFGNIRHRGAPVKNNGKASGAVHIMQLFETMVDVVSQGSVEEVVFHLIFLWSIMTSMSF
jgi:ribonucleoside-diphosphate reductase alpha chain